jgi:hypothetical protein
LEELESEAVQAELKEQSVQDKMMTVEIDGRLFRFRESQMDTITDMMARGITEWLKGLKVTLSEKEYLAYLCVVDEWLGGV